uniref:hypothetical protein n=1 Tax=Actinomadura sp. CA-154981 TaxID=3240037 RepID=UPI003F499196
MVRVGAVQGCRVRDGVERLVLAGRELVGVRSSVRHLDLLAVTLDRSGWGCVPVYRLPVRPLPVRVPVLWVHGRGNDAGLAVTVLATCAGWAYMDAGDSVNRFLGWCWDRPGTVAEIDGRLMAQISEQDGPEVPLRFGGGR